MLNGVGFNLQGLTGAAVALCFLYFFYEWGKDVERAKLERKAADWLTERGYWGGPIKEQNSPGQSSGPGPETRRLSPTAKDVLR